jgi:hypothetical protein
MTTLEIGGLCLLAWATFHWLGIFAKVRTVLAFVGVCCLTGGFLGGALTRAATWMGSAWGTATAWAVGVGVPAGLLLVLGIVLLHDMHPKHTASKRTSFIAMAVAALLVVGVAGAGSLNSVPGNIRSGISQTVGGR